MTQDIHDCQVRQTQDHTTVATLMWITEITLLVSYVNCVPPSLAQYEGLCQSHCSHSINASVISTPGVNLLPDNCTENYT